MIRHEYQHFVRESYGSNVAASDTISDRIHLAFGFSAGFRGIPGSFGDEDRQDPWWEERTSRGLCLAIGAAPFRRYM